MESRKLAMKHVHWATRPSPGSMNVAVRQRRETLCGNDGSTRERTCQLLNLLMLASLPGIILIIRNTISVVENVKLLNENNIVKHNIDFSLELSLIIHNLQIERGTSALYISSDGDPFLLPRLVELYSETDLSIQALSAWLPLQDDNITFQSRNQFQSYILSFRDNLDPRNVTLQDAIEFYTNINSMFIKMIAKSTNLKTRFKFWTELTAYQMLIISKEQAGIERALGSTYYARGKFPLEDLLWYKEKQTLGKAFLDQCEKYSSFASNLIDSVYSSSPLALQIEKMRGFILNNAAIPSSVLSGAIWFDNMTEYINILKTIQDELAFEIVQFTENENSILEEIVLLSSIELSVAVMMLFIITFLVRNIIRRIHIYSADLKEKSSQLEDERRRTEGLLFQMLPRAVAKKLMLGGSAMPEAYKSATIMFSDVVGFTSISSQSTPMQVINMINKLYMTIDTRLESFDVYKVETIGDGYMVASGLPNRNGDCHVEEVAKLSLDLLTTMEQLEIPHLKNQPIQLRIGFNTGPCVAGVVGVKMPRYCIFGDTVNTASRMESTGLPLRIQMTQSSEAVLRCKEGFSISERGNVQVKGKGLMKTFWLDGYDSPISRHKATYDKDPTSHVIIEVKQKKNNNNQVLLTNLADEMESNQ